MIEFLAHRGFWTSPAEKNSVAAFERAFAKGYGVETDVRDLDGTLVISHDIPRTGAMTLDDFLALYTSYPGRPTLALNVKADGLQAPLAEALARFGVSSYFVFDMSVPDTRGYLEGGMTTFTRRSEYETGSVLDDRAQGLWLDAFERDFVDPAEIAAHLAAGTTVALVSPELHRKPHEAAWAAWRDVIAAAGEGASVMLCTDLPDDAAAYF